MTELAPRRRRTNPDVAPGQPARGIGRESLGLSHNQHLVLTALCRPLSEGGVFSTPATNQEIASELYMSVGAVKAHLRQLFDRLDVEDLPQNRKRLRLVQRALETGVVRFRGGDEPVDPSPGLNLRATPSASR